jgi:hypothetical protein
MTELNAGNSALDIEALDNVAGGMPFFGMGCSINQHNKIGAVVDALEGVPIIGGLLGGIATFLGRAYCGGL